MPHARIALLALTLAACSDITSGEEERVGQIHFELRAQQQQQDEVSVLDRVFLLIQPPTGRGELLLHLLEGSQSVVTFPVRVREGTVRFTAEVQSNNATLLFSGDQSAEIVADGFEVTVPLTQQAPVLFLRPASLDLRGEGSFQLINRVSDQRIGSLVWSVDSVTPPVNPCPIELALPPCVSIVPSSGTLQPNSTQSVRITHFHLSPRTYTVRLTSRVGDLDLVLRIVP